MKDYYAILGVSAQASTAEIKKAFRRLAIRYHPDKNDSAGAIARFHEINEAYDILGDADRRRGYDALRAFPVEAFRAEEGPRHRDPAYRRRRYPPPPRKTRPSNLLLMQRYLPAMMWISHASLVFLFVFFVDYFLPWREATDQITGIYVGSRNNQLYYDIETLTGKQVRLGGSWRPEDFADGQIRLWTTPVFNSVTRAGSLTVPGTENVAHMYTTHVFFPLLLLLISILAIVYQHKVEFCFNLNLVGLILFIINLILI